MRILTLDLKAYGPFTKTSLDLSGGQEGLHIIYGLNEAGKSSALRALTALFYGIDHKTRDNFLHENRNLRIGATIQHSDKSKFAFIRRKGNKNTLLDTGERPIADSALQTYLGGVSRELFSTLFGINHKTLVEGGMQLVAGHGNLGESLFAAGIGITGLRDVLQSLQNEAIDLFKPGGSLPIINSLINNYNKAKKKSNELSLSSREWRIHDKALNEAWYKREKVRKELNKLRGDKNRLERMQEALPIITERRDVLNRLKVLKDVPVLAPSFSEERQNAIRELFKARTDARKVEDDLNLIKKQIKSLSIPEDLTSQDKIITELHKRLGSQIKAQQDLPMLQGEWEIQRANAKKLLLELRPGLALEDAGFLRLTETKRVMILDLGGQYQAILDERKRTTEALDELETDLAGANEALKKLKVPLDTNKLKSALRLIHKQGDLEEVLRTVRDRLEDEEKQTDIDLKALPLWSGTLEELEALPVPSSETIDRFSSRFDVLNRKINDVENCIKENEGEEDKLDKQIKALQIAGSVPTEQELIETRQRRNHGWNLVRRAWIKNEDVHEESKVFDPQASLDEAYEKSVNQADEVADRLRREARRVEKLAQLLASREQCEKKLKMYKNEHERLLSEQDNLDKAWNDLWNRIGIKPQLPKEMEAWLKKEEQLVDKAVNIRKNRCEVERIQKLIHKHRKNLQECLELLGEKKTTPDESLNCLLDRCQILIDEIEEIARQRKDLEKTIKDLEKKRSDAKRKNNQAQYNINEWNALWSKAVTELGLSVKTTPNQANAFITRTQDLFEKIDKADGLSMRIKGIKCDATQFEADVKSLLERVAPDLLGTPVYQAAETLNSRLHKAREDRATLKQLDKRHAEKEEALREANVTIIEMTNKLEGMCQKVGCTDYEDLEEIEGKSSKKRILKDRITQLETELKRISHGGGLTTDELIQDAEKVDPDVLTAQVEDIEYNIEENQNLLSGFDNTIGREEKALELMDGSAAAAEAAEEAQGILARIRSHTEQYMRLRMASAILGREIERYREANQDPILQRAGQIFAELTSGSFSDLKPSYDEKDNPILLGIRPSGAEVTVDGMSEGTCDQLYLSLRLASLEKHIIECEPMPFIVDDILINFDDARATATMQVLAKLSEKTQIIFFTHHRHLVELVKANINKDILFTHSL